MSSGTQIEKVVNGDLPFAVHRTPLGWTSMPSRDLIMLSGSFRPLHRAHRALLNAALEIAGNNLMPCFEISIRNVEKPDIEITEMRRRVAQFKNTDDIVVITRSATFLEKARLMPGTTFVIGYDTAVRLFDDRFYTKTVSSSDSPSIDAMCEIKSLKSRFIVGGRHDRDGTFRTVRDIEVPHGFESMLVEIPEALFADEISSTWIRENASMENA